ncbi:MAG: LPS export ABC transporter permease LptG [Gammaproteobacteria bacterium]|nr:LPS export ABC transporter permease LptG [Gammaproteobacteria bacterium]
MIIDRYIARSIISTTLGVLFVFAALFLFIDFVRQLEHIGTKDFGLMEAIIFVLLSLPKKLYDLAPSIILLGGLISMGAMATNSELVVMRSSGITVSRIIRSVIQTGLVLAILVGLMGEFVAPYATSMARNLRAAAMDEHVLVGGAHGLWARDDNRYFNVKTVMPDMKLRDVSIYQLDENRKLKRSSHARSASFQNGHWLLRNVRHSEISETGVKTYQNKREEWSSLIKLDLLEVLRLEPEEMSALSLMQYSEYLEENELDAAVYQLAFWMKLFTPLACLVMLLIAIPMVFTTSSRSGGIGQRVVIGLLFGILFFIFNRAINHLGVVYNVMPVISASIPLVFVTIITVIMIRRIR